MRNRVLWTFLAATISAGCNDASIIDTGTDTPPPIIPGTTAPASVVLLTSAAQLSSDASTTAQGVILTALVRDASNNVLENVLMSFSTPDSAAITVTRSSTDANGTAEAIVTTGGDPQNRAITVIATAVVSGVASSVTFNVVGTTLTIDGAPSTQFGTATPYALLLTDSSGSGIPSRTLTISSQQGNALSATTLTTNSSGQATVTLTPTSTVTPETLTVTALGITATKSIAISSDSFTFRPLATPANTAGEIPLNSDQTVTVRWLQGTTPVTGQTVNFSTTRGVFVGANSATTNGSGDATVTIRSSAAGLASVAASSSALTMPSASQNLEFVATTPASISVQADPTLIATNQSSEVTAVVRDAANNLVKNALVTFNLTDTTGGSISAGSATTNSQGAAKIVYSSSDTTSAQGGVQIAASVTSTITDTVLLTVGSRAARIVLGTGNEIAEPDPTTYEMPYTAIVTDNAGGAATDAKLKLSVVPLYYGKGYYAENEENELVRVLTAICLNEDVNLNGILETGEDTDGDGILDPGNVAAVPPIQNDQIVGSDGTVDFNIVYPQDRGNWVTVRLSATAQVSGTESTERATFLLPIIETDAESPPGNPSPYGVVGRCDLDDSFAPTVEFDQDNTASTTETGAPTITVTVTLTPSPVANPFTEDVIVPLVYSTGTGIALNGADFTAPTSVTIPAGSTTATFNIAITDDALVEGTEFIGIQMGQPTNALVGANNFEFITLFDND